MSAELSEIPGQEGTVGLFGLASSGERLAQQTLGLGPPAERLVGGCQEAPIPEGHEVVGPELRIALLDGCLEQRDRIGRPTGLEVGGGQVASADERVKVVRAELALQPRQRFLIQSDRLDSAGFSGEIASAKADDGNDVDLDDSFEASRPDALPSEAEIAAAVDALASKLEALRVDPAVEP